ncbi:MAG TPA: ABC-F family ATP-binding cassette domain-containing protein [Verrucomicrobiota bacterium]|nr:ABC-F family ATP-binding cassette domain-containing protein [Verrucomicrobiota bacterium]HNT14296.1 ABC-F family ATP-binding cassette domain-containing protein [Verrucomicrobiota bacterium]
MLTLSGITKAYAGRTLFAGGTLQLGRKDRIGLVGPNGAGKSTLFDIIRGTTEPDAGAVTTERGVSIGFLPQESAPAGGETVLEIATAISPEFVKLRRIIQGWERDHPVAASEVRTQPGDVHDRYLELNGYQVEAQAKQILAGLSFREQDFNRPAREMSGGWVMRAHLARLLTQAPDLLMLDEPTNHLDLEALLWFQAYLTNYPGAIFVISHDREFLNALVDSVVEIRLGKLLRYRGNYDSYLEQRAAKEEQALAAYRNQQREIAALQEFADRFRAKASKASQAQSKLKQIERMEKIEAPRETEKKVNFRFPQPPRSGQRVVRLQQVHFAYGAHTVYRGVDFEAERGQRIVLVGPNGAGKSTLLKLLAATLTPDQGERELGHQVQAGYYSQYRVEMLDPSRSVLDEALATPGRVTEQFVRTLLGSFLFRDDDVFKKVSVLSGGEKSRLALVKLLLNPPNLLLMDEPTTHLDMNSIDALLWALGQFEGTLIFISHDVYFIRALANKVVHVNQGTLTHYAGDYQYYLDKTQAGSARAALTAGARPNDFEPGARAKGTMDRREQRRRAAEARQARSRHLKGQRQIVADLEKRIQALEGRQTEISAELEKPETYQNGGRAVQLNREFVTNADELARLTLQWEAEASKLTTMEAECPA